MKQQSLALTRRGIRWFHLGLEASAALILISLLLSVFVMLGFRWLAIPLGYFVTLAAFLAPLAQAAMIGGVIMATAAPRESKSPVWALLTLLAGIVATAFTIALVYFRWPMQWMIAIWPLLFVQALLMTRFLAVISSWILATERRDVTKAEGKQNAEDLKDVKTWSHVKLRFDDVLRGGITFLVVAIGFGILMRFFAGMLLRGIGMGPFFMLSGVSSLVAVLWVLILLMRFSRSVHTMNSAFRDATERGNDTDAHWADVAPDRMRPLGIMLGTLAILAIGGSIWTKHSLMPQYVMEQMAQLSERSNGGRSASAAIGKPAPEMTMNTIEGESIVLSEQRGRPVLLNFWATWCGPCVAEIPDLVRLANESDENELLVIGISKEAASTLKPFVSDNGIDYPIVSGSGWDAPFDKMSAVPTTYLVDSDGIIQNVFVGSRSYDQFKTAVGQLMEMAACDELVAQHDFLAAAEAYQRLADQHDSRNSQDARRHLLRSAAALQMEGSPESISRAGDLLLSSVSLRPGDSNWNLQFATWLLDSNESDRVAAIRGSEQWFEQQRSKRVGNWLLGWVLAADGNHSRSMPILSSAISSSSVSDAYDYLFYAQAQSDSGDKPGASESVQESRLLMTRRYGNADAVEQLAWDQRFCVERITDALNAIQDELDNNEQTSAVVDAEVTAVRFSTSERSSL